MTVKIGISVILSFILPISIAFSQEICNNGVDDNGNGLIDCNDPECQYAANIERGCNCEDNIDNDGDGLTDIYDGECSSYYGLTFVGEEDSDCSIPPPDNVNFFDFIDTPSQSQQNTVDTQSKMAIGDLDGDGIPEVIATSKWGKAIRVIASGGDPAYDAGEILDEFGSTGQDDIFPKGNYVYELEVVIADIDGDGEVEIFTYAGNRQTPNSPPDDFYLVALNYVNGELVPMHDATYIGDARPGIMGIADFDGDGMSELYLKNQIIAAETGAILAQGTGDWETEVNSAPVAVNVLPATPNLELVSGGIIYTVPDFSNRNPGTPATLTVAANINDLGAQFYPKELFDAAEYGTTNFSSTSVADMNGDGNLDIVLSGARGSSTGNTAIYFWDVANNTYSYFEPPDPTYPAGWIWGTSRPNLGDANGDGQMDILFIAGNQLFAMTLDAGGNIVPLWPSPRIINDSRSGIVAVTIYDFDNDGNPEVVYRDSQQLVIVDGATGQNVLWSTVCQSHTMTEGPIIADVNGDGGTDICVPCYTSTQSFKIDDPIQQQALGGLRTYFSSQNLWLPTRKVWNQPGYFVVNINDDLTVPRRQMDQGMIFGTDPCNNGIPGPIRPFNIFLNQVPTIGADGCPFFPAPDISFVGDNPNALPGDPDYKDPNDPTYFPAVHVIPPICGDLGIEVEFNIINDGSLTISSTIPVSFWDGDPTIDPVPAQPATLLYQEDLVANNFRVGDTLSIRGVVFNSTGKAFRLFIVLNDDGSSLPTDGGNGTIEECKIENNVYYFDIIPDPFEVSIAKIQDNVKCEDSAPDDGELRAVVTRNGVEINDYSTFTFQWYDGVGGITPIAPPAGTSNVLTGLAEGDYSLIATNTDKGCASLPTDTSIVRIGVDPEIIIVENSPQSQCDPPNGELEVFITGGNTGFTFEWFDRFLNPLGITGSVASNLVAGEYIVSVFKDGCTKTGSYTLSGPTFPVVQTSLINDVIDCANLNSGRITAEAIIGGLPQDSSNYTFSWYEWDTVAADLGTILPALHGTGPTRYGLLPGEYAVIVRDETTGCESDPPIRQVIQDLTIIPTIVTAELSTQTSCDPANPNGQLQAEGYINGILQDPSNLTFEWFNGDNTLPANLMTSTSGTNGEIVSGVAGRGLPYTVRVTTINNCSATVVDSVTEILQIPEVTATTFDNSICDPTLAAGGVYVGRVVTTSSIGGTIFVDYTNYTFTWYDGEDIINDPVLPNTSPDGDVLDGLDAGRYTVVLENNTTHCQSVPLTSEIFNVTTPPVITISEIAATNCADGTPNGVLTASVDVAGVPTLNGYSFDWFEGIDVSATGIPVAVSSGSFNESAQQLTGNSTYSVLVTNETTGCISSQAYIVSDSSDIPVMALAMTPNSICDPVVAGIAYNGTVTGTTDYMGSPVIDYTDYYFNLFDGSDTTALNTTVNAMAANFNQLDSGFYTVRAYNTVLGCYSDPVTIEVEENFIIPVISLTEQGATNCDPNLPNGILTADVGGTVAGHTFKWVEGTDVTDPEWSPVSGTSSEIAASLLAGDTYTVQVTVDATGCLNTESRVMSDSSDIPVMALAMTPNSICDPVVAGIAYNGTVTGTTDYLGSPVIDYTDYYFNLFDGSDTTALNTTVNAAAANFAQLDSGFYTVRAYNTALGCYSDPVTIEVEENFIIPVISLTEQGATNCDPNLPNGILTADVGGTVVGHTFKWVEGTDVTDPEWSPVSGTSSEIAASLLAGDTYTVQVTVDATGCLNTESRVMSDSSDIPVMALAMTPNSICDPLVAGIAYNGTVTGTTDYLGSPVIDYTDYYFNLFDGSDTTALNTTVNAAAANFAQLDSGFYTVRAYNTVLGCYSDPVTIEVEENFIIPVISLTEQGATNCDPNLPNGILTADVGGTVVGHTFKWVEGTDVTDPEWSPVSGTSSEIAASLLAGDTYTVQVTVDATGCLSTAFRVMSDSSDIPVMALAMTPNSICDPLVATIPYNGTVTGTTDYLGSPVIDYTDYYFNLFDGSDTTALNTTVNAMAANFNQLDSGFYTVRAYNTVLGCYSDPVTIEVEENFIIPVISLTEQGATNCDPNLPNGILTADVGGTVVGHTFKWVEGTDVTDPEWSPVSGTASEIAGSLLAGDTYTVQVTVDATGCLSTAFRVMSDSSDIPVMALAMTPNSICDPLVATIPYNGTVTGTTDYLGSPVIDYTDYYFNLFDGSDTTALNTTVNAMAANFNQLDSGFYTVRAYNTVLGCYSDPVTIEVEENFIIPVISLTEQGATNCDPNLPNGILTADVGGTVVGHTFKWVEGTDVTDPEWSPVSGTASEIAGSLLAGDTYTVQVTVDATGCLSTAFRVMSDSSDIPVMALAMTPNSICDPVVATIPYNGTVTGTTDYMGSPVIDYTDYYFNLFDGSDTTALNTTVNAAAANFAQLDSGFYTVRAYNTALGCYSDPVTIEVEDNFIIPVISLTEQGATNCDPNLPNGILTADVGGIVVGHTFKWVEGTDVTDPEWSPVSGTASETAASLLAGDTYTVLATVDATGCINSQSRILSDSSELPIISLVQTPNTVCDIAVVGNFDGTVTGTLNYQGGVVVDHTPYDFRLFEGNDTTGVLNNTIIGAAPAFVQLNSGDYTMRAYDYALGCFSSPVSINVLDARVLPDILLVSENNSSCDDSRPNGNIQAYESAIGDTVGFDFTWYDGGLTTDPVLANINEIRDLPGNQNYTVELMNRTSGCVNTLSTFLGKNIPTFSFSLDVTDIVDCNTGGSILATVDSAGLGPVADYTNYMFYWYQGQHLDPGNELPETSRNLTGISPTQNLYSDFYTVYAENTYTHCMTDSITGFVNPPPPLFTIDHEINFLPSDCNLSEGAITATVGGNINDYNFYWYDGRNINPGSNFYTDPIVDFAGDSLPVNNQDLSLAYSGTYYAPPRGPYENPSIFALIDGIYSVVVQDKTTGCKEFKEIDLPSIITPPVLLGTTIGSSLCPYDIGDGVASARIHPDSLVKYGYTNDQYEFSLYHGISTNLVDTVGGSPMLGAPDAVSYTTLSSSLAPGYYTMQAIELITASKCPSLPLTVFVDTLAKDPMIDLVSALQNNNSCDSTVVNGAIEIDISKDPTDGTGATTYDINWTATSSTVPGNSINVAGGPQAPYINLNLGTYEVTVTDRNSTCFSSREYTLYNEPPNVVIEDLDISVIDKYACVPSGRININELTVDGVPEPVANYSFEWFDGDANLATNTTIAGAISEDLDSIIYATIHPGSYYVIATKDIAAGNPGAGCSTAPIRREILEKSVDPSINFTIASNQSCDPATIANGAINMVVVPGTLSNNLFDFTWNTFPAATPGDLIAVVGTQNFGSLVPGDYEIEVRDTQSECIVINQIVVNDNPIIPVIQQPDILIVDQSICAPDGSITVQDVILNGVSDGTADYTFAWYNTADSLNNGLELNVIPVVAGPLLDAGNYANIGAGNYYFTALKNNPLDPVGYGCQSAPYQAVINDISVDPILALLATANQSCDTSVVANGAIDATVTPGTGSLGNFNYSWSNYPTSRPPEFTAGAGTANELFISLTYGQYTLEIEDEDSRCITTGNITINDNPVIPVIQQPDILIVDQSICAPDGSITVQDVILNGVSDGTADYTFAWYNTADSLNNGLELNVIPVVAGPLLDAGNYANIGAGNYYFTALKNNPLDPVGYGCQSAPYQAVINDISVDPILALLATANQSCDTSVVANGAIDATVTPGTGSLGNFNYSWSNYPTSRPPEFTAGAGTANELFISLTYGQYTLEIEDEDSRCITTGNITINDNPVIPVIQQPDILIVDQSICAPDGSITVQDVILNGVSDGTADYTFAWYNTADSLNNGLELNVIPVVAGPLLDAGNYANIGAGNYYFTALKNNPLDPVGYGCQSAPYQAVINDISVDPILALLATANQSCDTSVVANGAIDATVTPGTGSLGNFNYSWSNYPTSRPPEFTAGAGTANELFISLTYGQYTLEIEDEDSRCITTGNITINDNPVIPVIQQPDILIVDQSICAPDGSITVQDVILNGVSDGTADYTFAWYNTADSLNNGLELNVIPVVAGPLLDAGNYANIGAGNYYFTALKNNPLDPVGYGCQSAPYQAVINDISVDPILALLATANQSCDTSVVANGAIDATVTPGTGSLGNFNYSWSNYPTSRPPEFTAGAGTANELFISLTYGQYTLEIEDEDSRCITTGNITINDNPVIPVIQQPDILIVDQSICAPDGSITVQDVILNGVSDGTADYTFAWYNTADSLNNGLELNVIPVVAGPLLDAGNYTNIGAGNYYFTALKNNPLDPVGYGCQSAPYHAVINDVSVDPILALLATANQTCDTAVVANGSITALVSPGSGSLGNFNYSWTAFPTDRPAEYTNYGVNALFSDRSYGQYTLEIEDADTRCTTQRSVTVNNNPFTPIIDQTDYLVNDQSVCFNDGSIVVFGIFPGDTSQYDFNWYESVSNLNSNTVIPGVVDGILDTTVYASIQAGDYYFTATNRDTTLAIGYGCETAPVLATINDISVDPSMNLTPTANENCDLSFANGTLTAITTTGGISGPAYSYTLSSTLGSIDSLNNDSQVIFSDLQPGNYNVYVIDDNTLCDNNRSVAIADSPVYIEITDVNFTATDQVYCAPDGSIVINDITENMVSQPLTDYTYKWYNGDSDLNNNIPIAGAVDSFLDTTNHATIGMGTYYFTVTKTVGNNYGIGCESAPIRSDIQDIHTDPNVIYSLTVNSSCDNTNPNGVILATAFENDGTDTDTYDFTWSYNGGALPAGLIQSDSANLSQLSSAPEGQYTLLVTNTSRTQCVTNSGTPLDIDEYQEIPNIIIVDATDPFFCYPTGELEVIQINVGGQPANVIDFEYEWYQSNFTPGDLILDSLGIPIVNPLLADQYPNRYYVIAKNIMNLCESNPKEVHISDANIVYPTLQISQSAPQTSCDPMLPNAALMATADGGNDDTNPDYQFNWFNGLNASGGVIATSSSIYGLGAGEFSVSVLNVITGCTSDDYYITEDGIENSRPIISVASNPQNSCAIFNGSVSAEVINFNSNFQFDWYIGNSVNPTPDYSGSFISGLPDGTYTVVVTELDTTFCSSDPVTVEIRDDRMSPTVSIEEDNPLTNCWITNPNGQFTATVNGLAGGYTFEWYNDTDTTGIPDYIGSTYSGLSPQSYTLVVTDDVTLCSVMHEVDLTDNTVVPPTADPELVQNLMSCIAPDGWVRASVNGNIIDYVFDWYNGSSIGSTADAIGVNYKDIDAGVYTVTAQDMITGCISEGAQVEVLDERELPEFTFDVLPAHCDQSDGIVEIVWENNLTTDNITWYDVNTGNYLETGSALYEYPAGLYEAVVTTTFGCEGVKEVEIGTEIYEFNGISANGDGRNDYFDIACITLFPDNHVRIYTRAGQLIYEAFGYNNNDVVFTGIGQNGVYLMGRELPDGTYFYIIDKRDGTEPIAGYLELIR